MIRSEDIHGFHAVWLENHRLGICVLPEKGADIYRFIYRPRGIQFLMQSPWGLKPPADSPVSDFLDNYQGGWQELFPNPGDSFEYNGALLPFHGEAALLPWNYQILQADDCQAEARFTVDLLSVPFRLERLMRLTPGSDQLTIEERVINLSDSPQHFCWGHHVVLGGDFIEAGCRMYAPAGEIYTPPVLYEPETAHLLEGQHEPWPIAATRIPPGGKMDLRCIPGPDAGQHEDIYLLNLERGEVEVTNPRLGLGFHLEWDHKVFRCIVNWRPLGGAIAPPLSGLYGLGIEPWTTHRSLADAIRLGDALELAPGGSLETVLRASVLQT